MSYPTQVQFNFIMLQAEWSNGSHILRRFLLDGTALPFSDSAFTSAIYDGSNEESCGLAVNEATGVVVADVPTDAGIVTRRSDKFGDPGSWETVGT